MKIRHIILLTLFYPFLFISQTLNIVIEAEGLDNNKIEVFVNEKLYSSNTNQIISVAVKSLDHISIKHQFHKDFSFTLAEGLHKEDSIYKIIKLIPKSENLRIQNLDEFSVSSAKYQNVFKNKNELIIDYYPFPEDKFFVATKLKGEYFIKIINEFGNELSAKKLNFKPQEIFLDAIGNFHIIEKDSVYQIYTQNSTIFLMKPIPKYDYEKDIQNLVALGDYGAFHQHISLHNQQYTVSRIIDKKAKDIYQTFDLEQYKTAEHYYNQTIGFYNNNTRSGENIISMGLWDGDLMTLNHSFDLPQSTCNKNVVSGGSRLDITGFISWSDKIASKPLNVKSFGLSDKIIVMDGVKDSVFQIQYSTSEETKSKAKFIFSGDYFKDYFYDNVYMFSNNRGEVTVSKINTEEGTSMEIAQLTGIHQPRNIKVMNDKIFFTVLDENKFNRIIEVK